MMRSTSSGCWPAVATRAMGLVLLSIGCSLNCWATPAVRADDTRPPTARVIQATLALAISPDDELLACNRGAQLHLYDMRGPRLIASLVDPSIPAADGPDAARGSADRDAIRSLAFDKSGDWLASGGYRTVRLWQRPHAKQVRNFDFGKSVRAAAVREDAAQAAIGLESGVVELVSLKADSKPITLVGHQGPITALCFTSAGLLSTSSDKALRLWSVDDGKLLGTWSRTFEARAMARIGGDRVAIGDVDGTIRLWPIALIAAAAGTEVFPAPAQELKGHSQAISSLAAVVALKDRLISGSDDGRVRVWDLASGQSIRELGHESPVSAVSLRGDGKRIVSLGPKCVRLWNAEDGVLVVETKLDWRIPRDIARADGALNYAKACVEYRKRDLREAEEALKRETTVVEGAVKAKDMAEKTVAEKNAAAMKAIAARSEAEQKATERVAVLKTATEARDAAKSAVELANATLKQAQTAAETATSAAEKDKDNKDLAAAMLKAAETLTSAKSAKQAAELALTQATDARNAAEKAQQEATRMLNEAKSKAQSPEREAKEAQNALVGATNFIVTAKAVLERATQAVPTSQQSVAQAELLVAQRDTNKQALAKSMAGAASPYRAVSFVGGGRFVALAGGEGLVTLTDADTGAAIESLVALSGSIEVAMACGDDTLLLGTSTGHVAIWTSPTSWQLARTIGDQRDPEQLADRVLSIDFSPDGRLLATAGGEASESGELKLWQVSDGTLVRRFESPHDDTIQCVRFSPDGQFLATAAADRSVKVFRVADGQVQQTLAGHSQHVLGVAWSRDGKTLASCGADQVLKIWNLETGAATRTMRGDTYRVGEYRRAVTSLMFVGDTEHVVASAGDRTVRLHRAGSTSDVRSFLKGSTYFHAAVATSDGKWVMAGGQDGVIHFWNGESGYRQFAFKPDQPDKLVKAE